MTITTLDPALRRAARHLIEAHGARAALAVAERRAANLESADLSAAAGTWRTIALLVRKILAPER
jgi:hypothetical protein